MEGGGRGRDEQTDGRRERRKEGREEDEELGAE